MRNSEELRKAVEEAKKSKVSTLIDIKVGFDSMSDGYESWWRVGTPEVSKKKEVVKAFKELEKISRKQSSISIRSNKRWIRVK